MSGPGPATAAVRVALRRALPDLPPEATVAAAVSGGADSLALAAALAFVRPGSHALVVDHGLQPGAQQVALRAAVQCTELGLQARVLRPEDGGPTTAHPVPSAGSGPEAAARALRYRLLDAAAREHALAAVLLGHTRDDQAETVLLGLARGSGARSLAGMAAVTGRYRRPLLAVSRTTTVQACAEAGLTPWDDPHNAEDSYRRVRVRRHLLPALEAQLGPGVAAALARTADLLREDADTLDALTPDLPDSPDCAALAALAPALRSRALARWASRHATGALSSAHVRALRALVEHWHGQGPVALPGGARVERVGGRLACRGDCG